jgi:hypothetical protein
MSKLVVTAHFTVDGDTSHEELLERIADAIVLAAGEDIEATSGAEFVENTIVGNSGNPVQSRTVYKKDTVITDEELAVVRAIFTDEKKAEIVEAAGEGVTGVVVTVDRAQTGGRRRRNRKTRRQARKQRKTQRRR